MDIVLGVSMAPATIGMVLVEGENGDGVTVDEDNFDVADDNDPATLSAPDQVVAAILGTREGATEVGYALTSTGVTWTDPADAAALAAALAARKVENVMLVSAFLAAAALAQTVGCAIGYEHTALLFVEPRTATLAVVASADGSITDVHRRTLAGEDPIPELAAMIGELDAPETRPQGLFVVGCGVDIAPIKPALEATSYLPVSVPEDPATALARGAALASANAPLFASSTAALAYAQDPGTGQVDLYAVSPGYFNVPVPRVGGELNAADLAYSAVPDDDADAQTGVVDPAPTSGFDAGRRHGPMLLVGSALAVVFVTAALALEIALALGIRPSIALRPTPGQALIAPIQQAPTPPVAQVISAPPPQAVHLPARPALKAPAAAPVAPPPPVPVAPVPLPVLVPMHPPVARPPMNLVPRPRLWAPTPPAREMVPPARMPTQPLTPRAPRAPLWRPLRQPPMNFPAPDGPRFPMRAPQTPMFPRAPAPMFPRMPAPMFPRMPVMPHFPLRLPGFRF